MTNDPPAAIEIALATGGRGYRDREKIFEVLDEINPTDGVMHGGASGVDSFAGEWAQWKGRSCTVYPADWKAYRKAAGPIRNREMANVLARYRDEGASVIVVVFPGGAGTANMKEEAEKRGLPIYEVFNDQ